MKPLWLVGAAALAALLIRRRGRLEPTLLMGGVIAVVGALLYGLGLIELPNLEQLLEDLGQRLGPWTYLLVGGLAFLETGAFVGLVAPGETAILVGGVVAGQGEIDIVALIALVWVAAVAGDLTSFALGRFLGREFLERHGRRVSITPERLAKVEDFFERHGGKAILLGRFVGLVRAIAPFLAGSSGMPLRRFLPYDVLGAGLWGTTFCLLGYLFWQSIGTVLDYAKTGTLALGSVIVVTTAIVWAVRRLRVPAERRRLAAWGAAQERRPVLGPVVRMLRRPGEATARFAVDRVTPGGLGLELTTLVALAAVGLFAVVAFALPVAAGELPRGDARAAVLAGDLRTGGLVDAVKVITHLGLLGVTLAATAVAVGVLVLGRRRLDAAALASGYVVMLAAQHLLRAAIDRPRPAGGLVATETASFPSAHTAHSVAWLAIAVAVARALPDWRARTVVVAGGAALVPVVAFTRVELGVHYLSDVAAGAGLGVACFALCGAAALVVGELRHTSQVSG